MFSTAWIKGDVRLVDLDGHSWLFFNKLIIIVADTGMWLFRKFPDFRNFAKKIIIWALYRRIGKYTFFHEFSSISGNFYHTESHLCWYYASIWLHDNWPMWEHRSSSWPMWDSRPSSIYTQPKMVLKLCNYWTCVTKNLIVKMWR